jgi:hypothetical protein
MIVVGVTASVGVLVGNVIGVVVLAADFAPTVVVPAFWEGAEQAVTPMVATAANTAIRRARPDVISRS